MKYIGYWEYDLKDTEQMLVANRRMREQMAKEPEKWAKMIGNPMVVGGCGNGYTIFEADEPDQLGRVCVWMQPWVRIKFMALFDGSAQMALKAEKDAILA